MESEYSDGYPTCKCTHATLRIYSGAFSVEEITSMVGIKPTEVQPAKFYPMGIRDVPAGWFLSSVDAINSRDVRRHIDWIVGQLDDSHSGLDAIRNSGGHVDIACFWVSSTGHGGPSIRPDQMRALGELELELWFDVFSLKVADRIMIRHDFGEML